MWAVFKKGWDAKSARILLPFQNKINKDIKKNIRLSSVRHLQKTLDKACADVLSYFSLYLKVFMIIMFEFCTTIRISVDI